MEKFWKHKSKFAAIALVLLLASVLLTLYTPVKAQADQQTAGPLPPGVTPNATITTEAYLSFRPNPVGVGQTILVNIWMHPPIHVARQFLEAFEVTFTDPDGNEDVFGPMDSYKGDGTAWFEYVPDQVGTWKVKFDFLGTYFPETTALSFWGAPMTLAPVYYKPSSTPEIELVVQEEPVLSWPPSPLPTDYWTRPVSPANREWWPILGSYPSTGVVGDGEYWPDDTNKYMSNYDFVPYVQGPNSAHVAWKRPIAMGGLIGGPAGTTTLSQPEGTIRGYPDIIYAGRAYDTYIKPGVGATEETWWRCYDIRTGELYWEQPVTTITTLLFGFIPVTSALTPTFVEYARQGEEVPGAASRSAITVYLSAITGGRIYKWDPWTGALTVNVTGPPSGVSDGTLYAYPYVLSVQNLGFAVPADQRYRLINWTIENNAGDWSTYSASQEVVDNFTLRVKGNITWPWSSLGTVDYESGIAVTTSGISSSATGTNIGYRLRAASLSTGAELWDVTTDLSTGLETFFSAGISLADHGKFAGRMQNGQWYCWDLYSGNIVWKSDISDWPWGVFGAYSSVSAYGLIYSYDYVGVHAINWTNGNIEWTYRAPTPYEYETPYQGYYSWHGAAKAADGKLYVYNSEHTPGHPITRGWRLHCINATTGEGIWNITTGQLVWNTIWFGLGGIPGSRYFQGAVADGYLALTNEYDGYLYVYGKGPSATTVTAPKTAISLGESVVIEGTVLDMSPGQPGTPCVSKDSMAGWMEYLHMQAPIPADVTGVPVSLDTLDPNGNFVHIGDVTTDMSGMFSHMWTPEIPGKFTVIATFMGDDSYGSSYAETAVGVVEAPEPPPEYGTEEWPAYPEPEKPADYTPMFLGLTVAIIVVAVLVVYDIISVRKLRK